jgi:proline iminopeptidase
MTPDAHTISEQMLPVGSGHTLYVHDWGSKKAKTTFVFLHGGPGSGCSDSHKKLFNRKKNRVIFFDQRGAGKSLPAGSHKDNTTQALIQDIEHIAQHFKLTTFVLVGGSWGSTLALAYSLEFPQRITALVLRGLFTGSQTEIDFLDKGGFKAFFPDAWEKFVTSVPPEFSHDPGAYHGQNVLGKNKALSKRSAYAYAELEGSIMRIDDRYAADDFETFDPSGTSIEVLYVRNRCFMPDNFILSNAHKLTMPVWLVQGRFDAVCPPITAYELSKRIPNNTLIWTMAGHSGHERANFEVTSTIIASFD